jgi:archaeosine synthase
MVRKQLDTLGKQKRDRIHELIVSEPLGIVPREMEGTYPAAHYDMVLESWFPTGSIPRIRKTNGNDIGEIKASATCGSRETDEIVSILADRVASYLLNTRSSYKHRIAFVRSSQRRILEEASRLAGIRIDFVLDRKIVQSIVRRMGDFYWVMNGMRCNESLSILKRTLFAIE